MSYKTWAPKAREGAVLLPLASKKKLILFGGVDSEHVAGLVMLNIKHDKCGFEILQPTMTSIRKLEGRFAFTGEFYQNKVLFFFGGSVFSINGRD